MNVTFVGIICVALFAFQGQGDQRRTQPPTVAISAFKMSLDGWYRWGNIRVLRDQVAAHLTQDYDCVVMNRSSGYALTMEEAMKRFTAITQPDYEPDTYYAADYSVSGIFQGSDNGLECVLDIADLRNTERPRTQIETIKIGSVDTAAPVLAKKIAAVVKANKVPALVKDSQVRTWVVMPFRYVSHEWKPNQPPHPTGLEMTLRSEIILHTNALVKLVDHSMIETLLKEHSMQSLSDAGSFRRLSKLTGADRLLIGTIFEEKNKLLRVDLLSVDTTTSEVLGSVTGTGLQAVALGETIEALTCKLLAGVRQPSLLVPADIKRREQEAEVYIATAEAERLGVSSTSGYLNVLECAEMAYLVARDSESVIRRMVKAFSTLCMLSSSNFDAGKEKIAKFVDAIAENHPNVRFDLRLLVDRAEAFFYSGKYEEALRVMRIYQEHNQGPMTSSIARLVTAQSYFALNQPQRALDYLPKDDLEYGNRQIWRLLRARVCRALGDEEGEFEALDTFGKYGQHISIADELGRYLELLAKRSGPASAVLFLDESMKRDHFFSGEQQAQLLRATYCFEAGEKVRAAKIAQRLWETGKDTQWKWARPFAVNAEFKKKLEALRAKTGEYPEKWLKAREIQPFPSQYVIYIQPLGSFDTNILEMARADVQDFYGATTKTLPALPLSKESSYFSKERNQFNAPKLLEEMRRKIKIPADAFIVACVTRENLYAEDSGMTYIRSRNDGWCSVSSYFVWWDWDARSRAIVIRNFLILNIAGALKVRGGEYPCITGSNLDTSLFPKMKLAFCEEAQKLYKSLDLLDERRKGMQQYQAKGIEILTK